MSVDGRAIGASYLGDAVITSAILVKLVRRPGIAAMMAYGLLAGEWLRYMRHLMADYPYLYSLALRTNPLDPDARPEVV